MMYAYEVGGSIIIIEADDHELAVDLLLANGLVGPGIAPVPTEFQAMGLIMQVRYTSRGLEVEEKPD